MSSQILALKQAIVISIQAVLKIFLVATAGAVLGRGGYLNEKMRSGIAKLVYICLLPCLLYTSIASTMDSSLIRKVYILPIFGAITPLTGLFVGFMTSKVVRGTGKFGWRQIMCCAGLQNGGYIPLVFVPAVLMGGPFNSQPLAGETIVEMNSRLGILGMSYVSTFLVGNIPTFWFFGRLLLIKPYVSQEEHVTEEENKTYSLARLDSFQQDVAVEEQTSPTTVRRRSLSVVAQRTEGVVEQESQQRRGSQTQRTRKDNAVALLGNFNKVANFLKAQMKNILSFCASHTTEVTCVAAVASGLFTPFQRLFFSHPGGQAAIFEPTITSAMRALGAATPPIVTILLGANMFPLKEDKTSEDAPVPVRVILGCFCGKLVIMPIIGIIYVYISNFLGLFEKDPILMFVIMLEFCSPTAQNLILMCELANNGQKEIATILFFIYLGSIITLTFWCTFIIFFINNVLVPL